MSDNKGYNGWTNYETWNLALWIDNEEGSQDYWREQAQECYREAEADSTFTRLQNAALDCGKRLQADIEENTPTVTGFYADVLNAAICEVNWYEIAEHWIEDEAAEIDAEEKAEREADEATE